MKARLLYSRVVDAIFIAIIAIIIAVNTYWYFEKDENFITTSDYSIEEYSVGDVARFSRDFCLEKGVTIDVTKWFMESGVYRTISSYRYVTTGYCGSIPLVIQVPNDMQLGEHEYHVQLIYNLNPLKRVIRTLTPIKFKVVG